MVKVVVVILVVVGVFDMLLIMGVGKLEHEAEEREWRELMKKREKDE